MKYSLFIISICLSAKALTSSWVEVSGPTDSVYIDIDNITKDRGFVFYSSMSNMSSMGLNSVITKIKADCNEKKIIQLAKTYYGQTMGRGIKYEEDDGEKIEFYPKENSMEYKMMNFACEKTK